MYHLKYNIFYKIGYSRFCPQQTLTGFFSERQRYAGGVCIYMNNKFANYSELFDKFTKVTQDFEILTVFTARPNFKKFVTVCVYKPPKGDIKICVEFLISILSDIFIDNKEIWILGDFNTDLLKRGDVKSNVIINFAKKYGLSQLINEVTRPNVHGGTCIDLIMTNCPYVKMHGVYPDMISDHYTVFAIRKKEHENKRVVCEYVRDYSKFDHTVFCQSLDNVDWDAFDIEINPGTQWDILYDIIIHILSVMCPLKRVHTRLNRKKWLTKEIYSLIRDRKLLVKRIKRDRNANLLNELRILRNTINAKVEKAKADYIRNLLNITKKDPNKFWRNIKDLINGEKVDTDYVTFKDPST